MIWDAFFVRIEVCAIIPDLIAGGSNVSTLGANNYHFLVDRVLSLVDVIQSRNSRLIYTNALLSFCFFFFFADI